METKININIKERTFDLEIKGLSLNGISNLSIIGKAVADNFRANLMLLGVNPDTADEAATRLLQGKNDIEYILSELL